ncbi:MAG: hypothetical protein KME64_05245 [Scytonematopsis contorta HA4267-MV1]|jgi:hypothetical protein|nr:hypothetical protein [Scytonematopsis contorta HA4267-MV1]
MLRRSFLKVGFLTTISWFFLESTTWAFSSNAILAQLCQKLLNLPHLKSFQLIGERYLKLYPEEAELKHLLAGFRNYLRETHLVFTEGDEQFQSWYYWLQGEVKKDFKLGQIVQVDGWILSKTEAQLCALATCVVPSVVFPS